MRWQYKIRKFCFNVLVNWRDSRAYSETALVMFCDKKQKFNSNRQREYSVIEINKNNCKVTTDGFEREINLAKNSSYSIEFTGCSKKIQVVSNKNNLISVNVKNIRNVYLKKILDINT